MIGNFDEDDFNCDYYHILMAQGFFNELQVDKRVCFEVFFRYIPFSGGYAVFSGLDSVIQLLERGRFSKKVLEVLRKTGDFQENFLEYLSQWKFQGDIDAPKEGEIIFPFSPILRIQGNILECHLIEAVLLNRINYQSLIATRASRFFSLSKGVPFVEMGLRRAYGPNGALLATRSAFIGGASATSNLQAGVQYNIPIIGSMSHSWVMSHDSELLSFIAFGRLYPTNQVFLLDTYSTLNQGLPHAIEAFRILEKEFPVLKDKTLRAVRIDSGDLDYISKKIREKLDEAELKDVKIMASDGINEQVLFQLTDSQSPIDIYGIGTALVSKFDSEFQGVYKLVSIFQEGNWEARIKISESPMKTTIAGRKNIVRFFNKEGMSMMDYVFLEEEREELWEQIQKKKDIDIRYPFEPYFKGKLSGYSRGEILLERVFEAGRAQKLPTIHQIQEYMKLRFKTLQSRYKRYVNPHLYRVGYSKRLSEMTWKTLKDYSTSEMN